MKKTSDTTWTLQNGDNTYVISREELALTFTILVSTKGDHQNEIVRTGVPTFKDAVSLVHADINGIDIDEVMERFRAMKPGTTELMPANEALRTRILDEAKRRQWKIRTSMDKRGENRKLLVVRDWTPTRRIDPMVDMEWDDLPSVQTTTGARDEQVSWRMAKGHGSIAPRNIDAFGHGLVPSSIVTLIRAEGPGWMVKEYGHELNDGQLVSWSPRGRLPQTVATFCMSWFDVRRYMMRARLLWRGVLHEDLGRLELGEMLVAPYQNQLQTQVHISGHRIGRRFKTKKVGDTIEIWALDAPPV